MGIVLVRNRIVLRIEGDAPLRETDRLEAFLPSGLSAAEDNFGQGEGQMRIEGVLWGIYQGEEPRTWNLIFEEGVLSPSDFARHAEAVRENLAAYHGCVVTSEIVGCWEGVAPTGSSAPHVAPPWWRFWRRDGGS